MFALISRILNLSGRYKSRIQAAFLCAFVESILSKMPIFMAFIVFAGFADNTLTGKTCLFVGLGLLAVVVVQTVVHYLSDRLQSAAGFMIFADKRMELGNHLRKMPMGYFTSGNIGKISSVLSTDMVFIEEVSMYHWQHDELYAVYFGFSCFYVRTGLETWADCGNHYLAGIAGCKIYE